MRIRRARLAAALVPILFGAAAAVAFARAPQPTAPADRLAAATAPASVIIDCRGQQQVRPATIVLACADGNAYLSGLRWSTWRSAAYGTGTWRINDCTPSCAQGRFHGFPALAMLWRPEPLRHQRGVRSYTRITMVLPGARCYPAHGRRTCYPASYTGVLWSTVRDGLPLAVQPGDASLSRAR